MDCEGCEDDFILDLLHKNNDAAAALTIHGGTLPFGQFLVEFHKLDEPAHSATLLYALETLGYRLFHAEQNPQCPSCAEFSFIHESLVRPPSEADCRPPLEPPPPDNFVYEIKEMMRRITGRNVFSKALYSVRMWAATLASPRKG
eukprot:TRINITY_DN5999_c0_g2_i2.p1 TRINITY_DN5999_c0_g2~~TRINITY_DN5999_c0_g2_i2.p1  ORF type:complete len:162 (-),score=11.24 TRINITY_DN5999_c0_g2_i2:43-477(-)